MKRIALFVAVLLAVSTAAFAQRGRAPQPPPPLEPGASQADVDTALMAAPSRQRDQATVVKWNPDDFTYTTLRQGTNRLVCYELSGFPLRAPFAVQCTSIANYDRIAQNLRAESTGDRETSEAMLKEWEEAGTRVSPEYGSMWWSVNGASREEARPHHLMIAVPGATTESTGLPTNPREGGAWIMGAGTLTAHIMMPS